MGTEIIQKPKKKFSVGAIFCLVTAVAITCFGLWGIIVGLLQSAINVYNYFSFMTVHNDGYFYMVFMSYIGNIISGLTSTAIALCSLIAAVTLVIFGILLLFKVKSRFVGLIFVCPAAASVLAIVFLVGGYAIRFVIALLFDARWALSDLVTSVVLGALNSIPHIATVVCWIVLAIVILALGGSKRYSKTGTVISCIAAAVVALLFVGTQLIGFGTVALINGMTILTYLMDIMRFGAEIMGPAVQILLTNVGSIIVAAIRNGVLGVLFALTTFFSVKWIIAPYKKAKN